jgi:hypothetical protein
MTFRHWFDLIHKAELNLSNQNLNGRDEKMFYGVSRNGGRKMIKKCLIVKCGFRIGGICD